MKTNSKKLKLKRETVRTLTAEEAGKVGGGTSISPSEVTGRSCVGEGNCKPGRPNIQ